MSITRLMDIASRSLGVYQRALDVTSHNVSNANNPDFSRQRVLFSAEKSEISVKGDFGTGVQIEDVLRSRNQLTDLQIRNYNQKYSDANKRSDLLDQVESVFSEPSELGLSNLMNSFFNSWQKLAVTPNDNSLRNAVVSSAQSMANKIQNLYEGMDTLRGDIVNESKDKVRDLNNYVAQIQTLNKQIVESAINNNSANDLKDQRDKAIDSLSQMANITVNYDDMGGASVSIGGVFACDTYNYVQFKSEASSSKLSIKTDDGAATLTLNGGELSALSDLYTNKIPEYQGKIDDVGNALMNSVNAIHSTGFTLQNPPTTSVNFFTSYSQGKLVINQNIIDDPKNIAISLNGETGNGQLALDIANLANAQTINGQSIGDYYSGLVSSLGSDKLMNEKSAQSNQLVLDQLNVQKSSVSGVSIDEEMTNVIKFQRSYDASAKLIQIADQLLQTLLTMV